MSEAARAAETAARNSYGRLVAFLAARTRDVAGAEDALAEAFATALRLWPTDGVPDNPDAWLLTVARRRQTDALRRRQIRRAGEEHLQLMAEELDAAAAERGDIPDRRLALMFACAHPAIERGMRAPLILQTVLGLTAIDIASAFLIPPATMGQRLVRAKARILDAGIQFRVPEQEELPERLDAVLDAIYAAYSKGWGEIGDSLTPVLAGEAIWLGRLVVSLLPQQPETKGMLALMFYAEARRPARRSASGTYVPLEEQDIGLWDDSLIRIAETLLHDANTAGPSGRYQIEAAIQSAHTARRLSGLPNWPVIVQLYDHLLTLVHSPVIALNRAVALAEVGGPGPALDAIEPLAGDKRMLDYQPYWAARGHLLGRAGRRGEAYEALTLAMGLATDPAVRRYLAVQRDALGSLDLAVYSCAYHPLRRPRMIPTITAFAASPDGGKGQARDMRVRWALEEVGQPYHVRLVSFAEMKQPAHRALQPFAQIPTYEEGDLALFESGSIVLHIAERHPGLLPDEPNGRARAITWMFAAISTVEPPMLERETLVLLERNESWSEARKPRVEDRIRKRLSDLSIRLADADWLDGNFSAGDLMMVNVVRRLNRSGLLDEYPNLAAYVARAEARPAFGRAFAAQKAVAEKSHK
jgi:RNA polymerase sigma-70 factor (ECF subfamily)